MYTFLDYLTAREWFYNVVDTPLARSTGGFRLVNLEYSDWQEAKLVKPFIPAPMSAPNNLFVCCASNFNPGAKIWCPLIIEGQFIYAWTSHTWQAYNGLSAIPGTIIQTLVYWYREQQKYPVHKTQPECIINLRPRCFSPPPFFHWFNAFHAWIWTPEMIYWLILFAVMANLRPEIRSLHLEYKLVERRLRA